MKSRIEIGKKMDALNMALGMLPSKEKAIEMEAKVEILMWVFI